MIQSSEKNIYISTSLSFHHLPQSAGEVWLLTTYLNEETLPLHPTGFTFTTSTPSSHLVTHPVPLQHLLSSLPLCVLSLLSPFFIPPHFTHPPQHPCHTPFPLYQLALLLHPPTASEPPSFRCFNLIPLPPSTSPAI